MLQFKPVRMNKKKRKSLCARGKCVCERVRELDRVRERDRERDRDEEVGSSNR